MYVTAPETAISCKAFHMLRAAILLKGTGSP